MSQRANYFRLGMFIIVATVIFVALVVALSAGQIFKGAITMETYFNESVQGLDVGSAVKYRGVQVGRVSYIGFSTPKYQTDVPPPQRKEYVLVEAELEQHVIGAHNAADPNGVRGAVERGMRVRLAPVGITGTAYLEIDLLDPKTNPPLEIAWHPQFAYIPSAPSTYNQIVRGAQRVMAQLDEADIVHVVRDIGTLARTATEKVSELQLREIAQETTRTMRDARRVLAQLDGLVSAPEIAATVRDLAAASARLRDVLNNPSWNTAPTKAAEAFDMVKGLTENKNLHDALAHLNRTLARLDALTAGTDADVATALYNLRRATDNLRDLSESAKRYPGTIFSEPPPPVTLPKQ